MRLCSAPRVRTTNPECSAWLALGAAAAVTTSAPGTLTTGGALIEEPTAGCCAEIATVQAPLPPPCVSQRDAQAVDAPGRTKPNERPVGEAEKQR